MRHDTREKDDSRNERVLKNNRIKNEGKGPFKNDLTGGGREVSQFGDKK